MILVRLEQSLLLGALLCAGSPVAGVAQACEMPDSVRAVIPTAPPTPAFYAPLRVTGGQGEAIPLGVGHVHYSKENPVLDLPPTAHLARSSGRAHLFCAKGHHRTSWER